MQTLGLSDSTPRTESRLKSLFWPSIQNGADVDYLGTQGYWICALVALVTLLFLAVTGHALLGVFIFVMYYLSGVGVRERSRFAATMIFVLYLLDTVLTSPSIVRIILTAILLSNVRAVWIASRWAPESEQASLPPRLNETWSDKLADQLPSWLWPRTRIIYYIFSGCYLVMELVGVAVILNRHLR